MILSVPAKNLAKEIYDLAKTLEDMLIALRKRTAELIRTNTEKEHIQSELRIANTIQQGLLPKQFGRLKQNKDFEIYAYNQAAKETGGDLYDFFSLDKKRTGLLVADVSGKGIASALLMAVAKILIKTVAKRHPNSPAACLSEVNELLLKENASTKFITVFYGVLDTQTQILSYAVAGHNPPLLKHADSTSEWLSFEPGLPLSALAKSSYQDYRLDLKYGDCLLIYTDGVSEAENRHHQPFGEERLQKLIDNHSETSAQACLDMIIKELDTFTEGQEPFDDITMLCLRYTKAETIIGTWTVVVNPTAILEVLTAIQDQCQKHKLSQTFSHNLSLAADELLANSLRHRTGDAKSQPITLIIERHKSSIRLVYREPGEAYDMKKPRQAPTDKHWQKRPSGGLGLFLIQNLFDKIDYRYQDGHNVLELTISDE